MKNHEEAAFYRGATAVCEHLVKAGKLTEEEHGEALYDVWGAREKAKYDKWAEEKARQDAEFLKAPESLIKSHFRSDLPRGDDNV